MRGRYQRRVQITLDAGGEMIYHHNMGRRPDKVSVARVEGDAYLQFSAWTAWDVLIRNPGSTPNRSDIIMERVHSIVQ